MWMPNLPSSPEEAAELHQSEAPPLSIIDRNGTTIGYLLATNSFVSVEQFDQLAPASDGAYVDLVAPGTPRSEPPPST